MKTREEIQLQLRREFTYTEDGQLINTVKGRRWKIGPIGVANSGGYLIASFNNKPTAVHTLIWIYHYGTYPTMIDHIDGNRTNNRIENLREANSAQNIRNSKKNLSISSTSKWKGVSWDKDRKKWRARIMLKGKNVCLGGYICEDTAAMVYNEAANKYFEEFAKLNNSTLNRDM